MSPAEQAKLFLQNRQSIHLSTITDATKGVVETSVAPFIYSNGHFYIYVSELAQHTQNLLALMQTDNSQSENSLISGLISADEKQTEQIFARERLALQMNVSEVEKDTEDYKVLLSEFEKTFGEVVLMLQSLPDFHLFKLKVESGSYVRGFGQAFSFTGSLEQALSKESNQGFTLRKS